MTPGDVFSTNAVAAHGPAMQPPVETASGGNVVAVREAAACYARVKPGPTSRFWPVALENWDIGPVARVLGGGCTNVLAVRDDGTTVMYDRYWSVWRAGQPAGFGGARDIWWKRDSRLAVTASGGLLPFGKSSAPSGALEYFSAACTTGGGGARGIAAACSGTSPVSRDTDGDGLPDGWELRNGLDPRDPADGAADSDGDGLPDVWETANGLDPQDPADAEADPDKDGLTNLGEFGLMTDPRGKDTDRDGLDDGDEVLVYGTNPLDADTDGDGRSDGWEVAVGADPLVSDVGTAFQDTDGDGMPDAWEEANGLDPQDPSDADGDPDGDGLLNLAEYENGTRAGPGWRDTDGDGADDLDEVRDGSDPNNPADNGEPPPPEDILELPFRLSGDWAAWEMTVRALGPGDTRVLRFSMKNPGPDQIRTFKLRRGSAYRVALRWLKSSHHDPDWYCWGAQVGGLPAQQTYDDYDSARIPGVAETVAGDGWFADNADGLLTAHLHTNGDEGGNIAEGLVATLYVPKVNLDVNANGGTDDTVDGLADYLPGYEGSTVKIAYDDGGSYTGAQSMKLVASGLPFSGSDCQVTFEILETTAIPGFCMNSGSGETTDDFSFSASGDSRGPVQGTPTGDAFSIPVYCKDFGGWCKVRVVCRKDGEEILSQTFTVPFDANGNKIADKWDGDTFNGTAPEWDGETTFHGSDGDGLTRMEEYRGFLVQNTHERFSAVQKELCIHRANDRYGIPAVFAASVAGIKDITADEMNGANFDDKLGSRNQNKTPRIVNFRFDPAWHKVDQHGLWLNVRTDLVSDPDLPNMVHGNWGSTNHRIENSCIGESFSCPARAGRIDIFAANIMRDCAVLDGSNFCWDASARADGIIEETISHELGHAIGIDHHSPASWITVETVNYSQSGRWDIRRDMSEITIHGGDTFCFMRYVFSEIRAAISGDLDFDGIPLEPGEAQDADWTPTLPHRSRFCNSDDNCLSQIVIDDSDGN